MGWKVPILMYHSIKSVHRNEVMRSIHVSPRSFALQMRIIKALDFKVCSVGDAIQRKKAGCKSRIIALSFDDAYENVYDTALPILRKYGFSATIYAVAGLVGSSNVWDLNSGISENTLMSETQIRDCKAHGIEIGCHTHTHQSLIAFNCQLEQEILESKSALEERFDSEINNFCYPYGHYDDTIVKQVSDAGFKFGVTMDRGISNERDSELLLPRIPITWHTLPHLFIAKILTSYEDNRRVL